VTDPTSPPPAPIDERGLADPASPTDAGSPDPTRAAGAPPDPGAAHAPGPGTDGQPEAPGGWRAHSRPNVELRRRKARKIAAVVEGVRPLSGARVLEVGTGSGVISAELARAAGPDGAVESVDTMDTRLEHDGYGFRLTSGVRLPFPDRSFDVVVSNHVVEHVGTRADQAVHLAELVRVLAPGGVAYLATPSRWSVVEPHFKVPFLSWVPRSQRDRVVRLARAGAHYDVDPYSGRELRAALDRLPVPWADRTLDALAQLDRIEQPTGPARWLARAPGPVRRAARPALPTMVFLLGPR